MCQSRCQKCPNTFDSCVKDSGPTLTTLLMRIKDGQSQLFMQCCWAYFRGSLSSEGLIIGSNFAFWVGIDNKNSLKHYENSLKQLAPTVHGLYSGEIIVRKIFASEIFWKGGGGEALIIGILQYLTCERSSNIHSRRIAGLQFRSSVINHRSCSYTCMIC